MHILGKYCFLTLPPSGRVQNWWKWEFDLCIKTPFSNASAAYANGFISTKPASGVCTGDVLCTESDTVSSLLICKLGSHI